jgi:hypothetical protein
MTGLHWVVEQSKRKLTDNNIEFTSLSTTRPHVRSDTGGEAL